jgi:hypothetical protein
MDLALTLVVAAAAFALPIVAYALYDHARTVARARRARRRSARRRSARRRGFVAL